MFILCPAVISVFGKKKLSTKHFLVARDRQPGSAAPRHSFKIRCSTFGLLSTSFTVLSLTMGRKVKHNYWKRSFRPEEYLKNMEGREESWQEGKKTNRKKKKQSKTSKRTKSRQIWLCEHMANAAWQHCQVPLQNCRDRLSSESRW